MRFANLAAASLGRSRRLTANLGYGRFLAEVFSVRETQRAESWASLPRQPKLGAQPLDSARLWKLEAVLKATPDHNHQPLR